MSSVVVGIDMVRVSRIAESVKQFGARFLERIFTEGELAYCLENVHTRDAKLAARFAAKEAARKVLRIDDDAIPWRSIEIKRTPGGWCELDLHDGARALAEKANLVAFSISLTHEDDHASAIVVAQRGHT